MLCAKRDLASAIVEPTVLVSLVGVYWCDRDMDQYLTPTDTADTLVHIPELFIHQWNTQRRQGPFPLFLAKFTGARNTVQFLDTSEDPTQDAEDPKSHHGVGSSFSFSRIPHFWSLVFL
jgi:hypothetical protein